MENLGNHQSRDQQRESWRQYVRQQRHSMSIKNIKQCLARRRAYCRRRVERGKEVDINGPHHGFENVFKTNTKFNGEQQIKMVQREREREERLTTNGGKMVGAIVDDIIKILYKTWKPI